MSHFLLLFSLRILHVGPKLRSPELPPGDRGWGHRGSRRLGRPPSLQAASLPGPGRKREGGCEQLRESESREPEPDGPPPRPPSPAFPPARPPAQPARARGIVRWNTAPSSPRRGGKTPWCSPSKVGAQLPKTLRRPRAGRGRRIRRGPGSVGPRAPVGARTPAGAKRGPGCPRPAGGCHPRSCHPAGHPSPRVGAGRDSGGARRGARPPAPPPREPRRPSGHSSPNPRCAPVPGPRGGQQGSGAGTPPGPEFSRGTGRPGRALGRGGAGTRDEVHRPRAGVRVRWGMGRAAVTAGRRTLAVRRSKQAGPEARPEPTPPPRALPRGRRCTHTAAFV